MVNPNFDNPSVTPPLGDVVAAYADVTEYNNAHTGLSRGLANMFSMIMEAHDQIGPDASFDQFMGAIEDREASTNNPVVEADMTAELQRMMHDDTFMHAGISLTSGGTVVVVGNGDRITGEPLLPVITSGEVYKEFLQTIEPEELEIIDGANILLTLVHNLQAIITSAVLVTPGSPEDAQIHQEIANDQLRLWTQLAPEYKRLGLSDSRSYQELEEYVEYWGRDVLPEFLAASQAGYLQTPDSPYFSPAKWASDMNPEGLTERWESAADFIEDLMSRGKDAEFTGAVRANMKTSLDWSITDMARSEETSKGEYERRQQAWIEHGEQPYWEKTERGSISRTKPEKAFFDNYTDYYRNNRIALEAARLRFESL